MLPEYFALVSTAIVSLGALQYLYLTVKGKVQPNRVTFLFWGLFPLIAFFAQYAEEVSSVIWITLSTALLPLAVVAVSYLNPAAYWKLKARDYYLGGLAVFTILLWYLTNDAVLAIVLALTADFLAGIPTLIKSYTHPFSEDWQPYALNAIGFTLGIFAIQEWVVAEAAYLVYLAIITSVFTVLIFVRQRMSAKIG
ncbi:MAG: hypothetical protein ACI9SY_000301 [Candidatus Paceibacteria bacterium]|jgi:hypothetical protein